MENCHNIFDLPLRVKATLSKCTKPVGWPRFTVVKTDKNREKGCFSGISIDKKLEFVYNLDRG